MLFKAAHLLAGAAVVRTPPPPAKPPPPPAPPPQPQPPAPQKTTTTDIHAIRQSLVKLNRGIAPHVDEIINECGPRPSLHGALWVRNLLRKTEPRDRDIVLVSIMVACQGLRRISKEGMSDDPKDYGRILTYLLGEVPWNVLPDRIGVVIGMIKAGNMVADLWDATDEHHMKTPD